MVVLNHNFLSTLVALGLSIALKHVWFSTKLLCKWQYKIYSWTIIIIII